MEVSSLLSILCCLTAVVAQCDVDYWSTNPWNFGGEFAGLLYGDGLQSGGCLGGSSAEWANNRIQVDSGRRHQQMVGFGATMTESSAYIIANHPRKQEILDFLFKPFSEGGIDMSMVRLPVSMMSDFILTEPYTYVQEGDFNLDSFSIDRDKGFFTPLLREMLAIKPDIKFIAVPWSAPGWMKRENNIYGSEFDESYVDVYAKYLRLYLEAYAAEGITIDYLLPQNEPLHSVNGYPTMLLSADVERQLTARLIEEINGAGLGTKILIYGHNWDNLDYARSILQDPLMVATVGGIAFHCYAGDYHAPGELAAQFPEIPIFFEECTGYFPDGNTDMWSPTVMTWNQENLFVGQPVAAQSVSVLLWNIALDQNHGPNIGDIYPGGSCPGGVSCGCEFCRGLLTLTPDGFQKNVDLWAVAHSSAFVPLGSTRLEVSNNGEAFGTAYETPDGKVVVVAHTTYYDAEYDLSIIIDGQHYLVPQVGRETSVTLKSR